MDSSANGDQDEVFYDEEEAVEYKRMCACVQQALDDPTGRLRLYINNMRCRSFDQRISRLSNLRELYCHDNTRLKVLPTVLWDLRQTLQVIDASRCSLESVPEELATLKHLRRLSLASNNLGTFIWDCTPLIHQRSAEAIPVLVAGEDERTLTSTSSNNSKRSPASASTRDPEVGRPRKHRVIQSVVEVNEKGCTFSTTSTAAASHAPAAQENRCEENTALAARNPSPAIKSSFAAEDTAKTQLEFLDLSGNSLVYLSPSAVELCQLLKQRETTVNARLCASSSVKRSLLLLPNDDLLSPVQSAASIPSPHSSLDSEVADVRDITLTNAVQRQYDRRHRHELDLRDSHSVLNAKLRNLIPAFVHRCWICHRDMQYKGITVFVHFCPLHVAPSYVSTERQEREYSGASLFSRRSEHQSGDATTTEGAWIGDPLIRLPSFFPLCDSSGCNIALSRRLEKEKAFARY